MHAAAFQVENRLFGWIAPTCKRVFSMKRADRKKVTPYLCLGACSTNGSQTRDRHLAKAGRKRRTQYDPDQFCFQGMHTQT
ncbi:MAG TPA: hypothetical protein DCO78_08835 [Chitinophagaceae bacterium]|nr:hypothetical protein [Chitinophagaceae bacterium]